MKAKNDTWKYKSMSKYELQEIRDSYGYDKDQKRKATAELKKRQMKVNA